MSRLLVTGGAGFIGANYVHHHLHACPGDEVVVYDALTYASCLESLDDLRDCSRFAFVRGDIRDEQLVRSVMQEHAIDTIVHFAAESHVDRSIEGPQAFISTNVSGTCTLLQAACALWLQDGTCRGHFHHISTDEVFGSLGPDDPPFCEDTPCRPNSPYSASKAASDMLVRAFAHTYQLQCSITNCTNNYGPYQFPEKLIPLALTNLLSGREVPVYGDGRQVRDWLYVADHAAAIDAAMDHARTHAPETGEPCCFVLGAQVQKTNLEVLTELCTVLDDLMTRDAALRERYPHCPPCRGRHSRELLVHVTDRPGHDRRYAVDPQRARQAFGFNPQHGFTEGLRLTVSWYLQHPQWWQPLLARARQGGWRPQSVSGQPQGGPLPASGQ